LISSKLVSGELPFADNTPGIFASAFSTQHKL
jgi:hypothetical protein